MKVDFQCGDTITIPKGCKAVVKDGSVVFEKEEKEEVQEFKDGDVLCDTLNNVILIFKAMHNHARSSFDSHYNNKGWSNERWNIEFFHHATEEEKQLLFDKMKEQGLKWNAEEKKVEKARWRAKRGEHYSLLDRITLKADCYIESFDEIDTKLYDSGNYFRTKEQAEEAAKRVKETLRNYHEEIGE